MNLISCLVPTCSTQLDLNQYVHFQLCWPVLLEWRIWSVKFRISLSLVSAFLDMFLVFLMPCDPSKIGNLRWDCKNACGQENQLASASRFNRSLSNLLLTPLLVAAINYSSKVRLLITFCLIYRDIDNSPWLGVWSQRPRLCLLQQNAKVIRRLEQMVVAVVLHTLFTISCGVLLTKSLTWPLSFLFELK